MPRGRIGAEAASGQDDLDALLEGPEGVLGGGSLENQVARLSDPRLRTVQRQALAAQIRHQPQAVLFLANVGHVYQGQGDLEGALVACQEALATFQELGDKAKVATLHNNIGGIYQQRGDFGQALSCYEEALALDRELGHRMGEARELMNIGALYVKQRWFAEAEPLLVQAVETLRALGSPQVKQAQAWLALARAGLDTAQASSVSLN